MEFALNDIGLLEFEIPQTTGMKIYWLENLHLWVEFERQTDIVILGRTDIH